MAANGNAVQTANDQEIVSMSNAESFVLRLTKEILEGFCLSDYAQYINHVDQYIKINYRHLDSLEEAVKPDNSKSEIDVLINILENNMVLLEERLNIYFQSIQEEIDKIDIPMIRSCFRDPNAGRSVVDKIKVLYGNTVYDSIYGKMIDLTLVALEEFIRTDGPNDLDERIEECEKTLEMVKSVIPMLIEFDPSQIEADKPHSEKST